MEIISIVNSIPGRSAIVGIVLYIYEATLQLGWINIAILSVMFSFLIGQIMLAMNSNENSQVSLSGKNLNSSSINVDNLQSEILEGNNTKEIIINRFNKKVLK